MVLLTEHFSLRELTLSETAVRRGIDNTPPSEAVESLFALCENILEPARRALGPIKVTSGFRNQAVNRLVGGQTNSQHLVGEAADIHPLKVSLHELYRWLYLNTPFDQLIWEFGRWIHVSYRRKSQRGILTAAYVQRRPWPLRPRTVYVNVSSTEAAFAAVRAA